VGSAPLPALPASTGWQPSETVVEIKVPVNELVGTVLVTGLGVQLRASVNAGPDDWDLLNNSLSRMWIPEEMPKLFVDP
jgi:hypothetical protein